MTLDEVKQVLQNHFAERMVTIVGSGLSAAVGLPSMSALASSLLNELPGILNLTTLAKWQPVADQLNAGCDLESALRNSEDDDLNQHIRAIVALHVGRAEKRVIAELYTGSLTLAFSRLLPRLTFANGRAEIITPNYDRLVEFSAELAGYGVDTTFTGTAYGLYDDRLSKDALSEFVPGRRRGDPPLRKYRRHIVVYKPHGSLDWYLRNQVPTRCSFDLEAPRLLITPGANKYKLGYSSPFDVHREAANRAIDRASRFLVIGYGFNDDQLEQHLRAQLRLGYPALIITRSLSPNATRLLADHHSASALSRDVSGSVEGTLYQNGSQSHFFPSVNLWDLEVFSKEVLGV